MFRLTKIIFLNLSVSIFTIIGLIIVARDSEYFNYGPSSTLKVASFTIDNWNKYFIVVLFVIIHKGINAFRREGVIPWKYNTVYNDNIIEISEVGKKELMFIVTGNHFIEHYSEFLEVFLVLSQIDIAIITFLSSVISVCIVLTLNMKKKHFLDGKILNDELNIIEKNNKIEFNEIDFFDD